MNNGWFINSNEVRRGPVVESERCAQEATTTEIIKTAKVAHKTANQKGGEEAMGGDPYKVEEGKSFKRNLGYMVRDIKN